MVSSSKMKVAFDFIASREKSWFKYLNRIFQIFDRSPNCFIICAHKLNHFAKNSYTKYVWSLLEYGFTMGNISWLFLIKLDETNTPIKAILPGEMLNCKLGVFEVGNFLRKKKSTFCSYNLEFLYSGYHMIKFQICSTPFPLTH